MVLANLVYYNTRMLSVHRAAIAGVGSVIRMLDVVAGSVSLIVATASESVLFSRNCSMVSFTNCSCL